MKTCPYCSTSHNKPGVYCCRACVNKARGPRSQEIKDKIRNSVILNPSGFAVTKLGGAYIKGHERGERETKTCPTCGNIFTSLKSKNKQYCTKSCVKLGGLREGSGRSKTGYYKGIYCGSTYELAFLIWHLEHGQPIARCTESFAYVYNGRSHKYWPDFKIGSQIYEIKGRTQHIDYVKIKSCNAVLVDHLMMQKYIKYVCDTYHVHKDKLWLLYDNPTLHQCTQCGIEFQPKTKKGIYCSQVCAMKGNRLKRL